MELLETDLAGNLYVKRADFDKPVDDPQLSKWDGKKWEDLNLNIQGEVNAIHCNRADGRMMIGGSFRTDDGTYTSYGVAALAKRKTIEAEQLAQRVAKKRAGQQAKGEEDYQYQLQYLRENYGEESYEFNNVRLREVSKLSNEGRYAEARALFKSVVGNYMSLPPNFNTCQDINGISSLQYVLYRDDDIPPAAAVSMDDIVRSFQVVRQLADLHCGVFSERYVEISTSLYKYLRRNDRKPAASKLLSELARKAVNHHAQNVERSIEVLRLYLRDASVRADLKAKLEIRETIQALRQTYEQKGIRYTVIEKRQDEHNIQSLKRRLGHADFVEVEDLAEDHKRSQFNIERYDGFSQNDIAPLIFINETLNKLKLKMAEQIHRLPAVKKEFFYDPTLEVAQNFSRLLRALPYDSTYAIELYDLVLASKSVLLDSHIDYQIRMNRYRKKQQANYLPLFEKAETLDSIYRLGAEAITGRNIPLIKMEHDYDQLELALAQNLSLPAPVELLSAWEQVQQQLGPKEAAIEIIRFENYNVNWTEEIIYLALVVTNEVDYPQVVFIEGNKVEAASFRSALVNTILEIEDSDEVYNTLWAPIQEKLKEVNTVYLSTDGVFNTFNLSALPEPVDSGRTYVADRLDIRYVTSTRAISRPREKEAALTATLIGSPAFDWQAAKDKSATTERNITPLPYSAQELKTAQSALRDAGFQVSTIADSTATESTLSDRPMGTIVHFASHGFFEEPSRDSLFSFFPNSREYRRYHFQRLAVPPGFYTDPAHIRYYIDSRMQQVENNPLIQSGIYLAGANYATKPVNLRTLQSDGLLTASEIQLLDFSKTDLVIMNACETAVGVNRDFEGVYGINRACLLAGANSIISTLWPVEDQVAATFSKYFYTAYLQNNDKRKAFRQAQLAIKFDFPDAYLWGAFIMIGNRQ